MFEQSVDVAAPDANEPADLAEGNAPVQNPTPNRAWLQPERSGGFGDGEQLTHLVVRGRPAVGEHATA